MVIWFNGGEFSSLKDGEGIKHKVGKFLYFCFLFVSIPKSQKKEGAEFVNAFELKV